MVADLPPLAQKLLLVVWLATLALYLLGLASVIVGARLAAVPVEEDAPAVAQLVPADAPIVLPAGAPSETPPGQEEGAVPALVGAMAPPRGSAAATVGALPPVPTLEPTPTQSNHPVVVPTSTSPPAAPRPTEATAPAATATPRRTVEQQAAPTARAAPPAPAAPAAGSLPPRGSFAKTEFAYPGDKSVYTVNLQVEPDDPGLLKNTGFIVYGPGGELVVRGGAQPGKHPNVSANVITSKAGRYVVQVQNYDPSRAITYHLEVIAAGPPG